MSIIKKQKKHGGCNLPPVRMIWPKVGLKRLNLVHFSGMKACEEKVNVDLMLRKAGKTQALSRHQATFWLLIQSITEETRVC